MLFIWNKNTSPYHHGTDFESKNPNTTTMPRTNSSLRAATYPIKKKTIATSLSRGVRSGARAKRRTNDAPSNPSSYGQIVAGFVWCGSVGCVFCPETCALLLILFINFRFRQYGAIIIWTIFRLLHTSIQAPLNIYTQTHSHSHNRMSPYILNKAKNCDIRCFCLATNCRTHSIFICVTSILPLNSCNTKSSSATSKNTPKTLANVR